MTNGDVILYDNCTTQPNADNDNQFCTDNDGDASPWDLTLTYQLNTK